LKYISAHLNLSITQNFYENSRTVKEVKTLKGKSLKKIIYGQIYLHNEFTVLSPLQAHPKSFMSFNIFGRATKICGMRRIERVSILKNR
jgi:hypothetical protein